MRTAEKEYLSNSTPFNKRVMEDLQNKVDGWIKWVHEQQDEQLVRNVPSFIGRSYADGSRSVPNNDVAKRLMENHTPEEIEKFINSVVLSTKR